MMSGTISSRLTLVYKFIFPIVWIGGWGTGTVLMMANNDPQGWAFLILGIFGAVLVCAFGVRLKVVRIQEGHLAISNFLREIYVPFSEISDVTENRMINIHPVRIYFHHETNFGPSIVFMPAKRGWPFGKSPVVAELKRLSCGS